MKLGWKVLVPTSLVWIMAVAVIRTGAIQQLSTAQRLIALGVIVGLVLLVSFLLPDKKVTDTKGVPLAGSGFPVPPLDLAVPKAAPKRKVKVANIPKDTAAVTTGKEAE
jgi:NADH-quinone oxidoreductase subunit H